MKALLTIILLSISSISFNTQAGMLDTIQADNGISASCSVYWSSDCWKQVTKTPEFDKCMDELYKHSLVQRVPITNFEAEILRNTKPSPEAIALNKAAFYIEHRPTCQAVVKNNLGY